MQLPKASEVTSPRKKDGTKRSSRRKGTISRTGRANKQRAAGRATRKGSRTRGKIGETFVFECTRPGCGYRIVREEKAELGDLRFDLKCPKCHNTEFKCLGKGDLPETLGLSIPTNPLNFDSIKPLDLGSN